MSMPPEFRDQLEKDLWAMVVKSTLCGLYLMAVMTVLMIFVSLTGVVLQSRDLLVGFLPGVFAGLWAAYMVPRRAAWSTLRLMLSNLAVAMACSLMVVVNIDEITLGAQAGIIAGTVWGFLVGKIVAYKPIGER